MGFAENLTKRRKQMGWTQIDLGIKADINPKTLSSYENGRTEPSLGEVVKLCKVFDCSIASLTGTKEREPGDISVDDIMFKLATLDIPTLGKIYNHISSLIQTKTEYEHIMKEKAEMEKKLMEYEKKLRTMESYGTRRE